MSKGTGSKVPLIGEMIAGYHVSVYPVMRISSKLGTPEVKYLVKLFEFAIRVLWFK